MKTKIQFRVRVSLEHLKFLEYLKIPEILKCEFSTSFFQLEFSIFGNIEEKVLDAFLWSNSLLVRGLQMQGITNPGVPGSIPVRNSKFNTAFHIFKVDQVSTRNSW